MRSRRELESRGVSFLPAGARFPANLPILADGATYSMAQEAAWLDAEHFAVGRWDGSLSIFRFAPGVSTGPIITTSASSPSSEGVQMITWLSPRTFASSNDAGSMIVWRAASAEAWAGLEPASVLRYDAGFGEANSGDSVVLGSELYLIVGHAQGCLTIWSGAQGSTDLQLVRSVDIRAAHAVNPWNLHNVRSVSLLATAGGAALVVTGSEDGDLCVVRVPDGTIVSRTVFNPAAQRGINCVAAWGSHLLVANCAVGPEDRNLWYYGVDLDTGRIELRDSINLNVNPSAPQVFNFCTVWGFYDGGSCFFSSTEEGALWMGTVDGSKLSILGYREVTSPMGSALAFHTSGKLVMVGYDLHEFITAAGRPPSDTSDTSATSDANPERLSGDEPAPAAARTTTP
jgi:hypothetical protein